MKRIFLTCFFVWISISFARAEDIGFRQISLSDGQADRQLEVAVWYPVENGGETTLIGDNPAFVGLSVIKDGQPKQGPHPLVVLSHGYGGNWTNQMWLASELVRQGYIVAAPNHPGTTSRDRRLQEGAKLWQRPRDLSRVIDAVIADPTRFGAVAANRIAAIGHSLGGWTAVAIAGGRFDADRFEADCFTRSELAACKVYDQLGIARNQDARAALGNDLRDERVKAVISLDLGLARGFTPASLAAIKVPVLVIAAGLDDQALPARLESRYLSENLPAATTHYAEMIDASHFSFLGLCKPEGAALIDERDPGEGFICEDIGNRTRTEIHREAAKMFISFLAITIP